MTSAQWDPWSSSTGGLRTLSSMPPSWPCETKVRSASCSYRTPRRWLLARTSRCKTEGQDNGIVPYGDIPEIGMEINTAVHNSGSVVTQGPAQPKEPYEEITTSMDMDMYVRVAMEASTAAEATAAWKTSKQPKEFKWLQHSPKPWNPKTGRGRGG